MSTALDRRDPVAELAQPLAAIDPKKLQVIKSQIAPGLDDHETAYFLELAKSLGLNPWAKQIWAVKGRARNGEPGKMLIMVGRDGLLSYAERYPDYQGYEADVVHANDQFERTEPYGKERLLRERLGVVHRYGKPEDRGDVVGAWTIAERQGRPLRYFYAAYDEYVPRNLDKAPVWKDHPAIMMEKVPISIVHRTLCGLGAVYLEEEVARALEDEVSPPSETVDEAIDQYVPEVCREGARRVIGEMSALAPNSWDAGKVQMTFAGRDPDQAFAELEYVQKAIAELRGPDPDITDADVVPDDVLAQISALQARALALAAERNALANGVETGSSDPVLVQELREVENRLRELGGTVPGEEGEL